MEAAEIHRDGRNQPLHSKVVVAEVDHRWDDRPERYDDLKMTSTADPAGVNMGTLEVGDRQPAAGILPPQ